MSVTRQQLVERRSAVLLELGRITSGPQQITAAGMAERVPSVDLAGWAATLDAMSQVAGASRLLYRVEPAAAPTFALAPAGWAAYRRLDPKPTEGS